MDKTRLTLIQRLALAHQDAGSSGVDAAATSGDQQSAWVEIDAIYRPLIRGWLSRYRLQPSDVEDLSQEVLTVLLRQIGSFEHNGRVGAFRNWLRTTTVNVARNTLRRRNIPVGAGGSEFQASLVQLEDHDSHLSREFDAEHSRYVVAYLLNEVENDFSPSTMQIFRKHVLEGQDIAETAASLDVSHASVHTAKSRVLRKLRQRAGEMLDDLPN